MVEERGPMKELTKGQPNSSLLFRECQPFPNCYKPTRRHATSAERVVPRPSGDATGRVRLTE
jgi:hypothetical protein